MDALSSSPHEIHVESFIFTVRNIGNINRI